ncbi:MAG TPA: thioredoxin domain-containing protein [Verrucomicrobiae bacterium]|nr:thioredoxin domain-containing protein [Verrucomicrobiae bacterium]
MTRTRWIIFAIICIVILGGLVIISNNNRVDVSKLNEMKVVGPTEVLKVGDHVYGNDQQKVTLIEYGDFQCPGCGSLHPVLKPMIEKYKEQLTFVFRNFPLTNIHPNALAAAATAEAAGRQGKFYQMHDALYNTQSNWTSFSGEQRTNYFQNLAKQLGLDEKKFKADLTHEDVTTKIRRDQALGGKSKVDSTPTLFINGKQLGDNVLRDATQLEETIKKAITDSGQKLPEEPKDKKEDS